MNVQDLMTREVKTCAPYDTLEYVAKLMWENDCGAVPVVDEFGRLVGMITDRDIYFAAYSQSKLLSQILVQSVALKRVVTVASEQSAQRAESLMREKQVRRLAVTNHMDALVGILSLNDLAQVAAR